MQKTSAVGIELIKQFEGLELESYQDIADVWTIGYGHTETAGPNQRISEREAEELLRRDLVSRERGVSNLSGVPLNQNEFDALVSFVYNVGENAFRGSTARRRLNQNNRMGAADALTWWNKATVNGVLVPVTGLTRRRAAERALFLTPVDRATNNDITTLDENSRIKPMEDPPRRGNLGESRTIQGASVAGGAGVASTTMGRDSAQEIDDLETNIEDGVSLTENREGSDGKIATTMPGSSPATAADESATNTDDGENAGENAGENNDGRTGADDAPTDETTSADDPGGGPADNPNSDPEGDIAEEDLTELTEVTEDGPPPPSKHDDHSGQAQIQLALMVLIIFAVIYIIFARVEDWFRFRR